MPDITASFTKAQTQLTTRPDIFKRLLSRTEFGQYGTATGGSTSTVIDTTRLSSSEAYGDDQWVGSYVRLTSGSAAGQVRVVTDYVASTGTLTVSPVFGATASGATYELWKNLHPTDVVDLLDQIMTEECFVPDWAICTEVPDGDMEQNNITDWTAGGTAIVAKDSTEPRISGVRYLTVTNAATDDYARSNLFYPPPTSRGYHLSALVRASVGTATLIAYDETNGAALRSVSTTSKAWTRVWFDFNTLSTTEAISIRLAGEESTAVTWWDDVCFYGHNAQDLRLPWWVKNRDHIRGVYRLQVQDGPTTNTWDPSLIGRRERRFGISQSRFGPGAARLVVGNPGQGIPGPVYVYGLRNETAYASDTETKHIDIRWATAKLAVACYQRLLDTVSVMGTQDKGLRNAADRWAQELERLQAAVVEDDNENYAVGVPQDVLVGRNRGGW